jgi:hypothetical protein
MFSVYDELECGTSERDDPIVIPFVAAPDMQFERFICYSGDTAEEAVGNLCAAIDAHLGTTEPPAAA